MRSTSNKEFNFIARLWSSVFYYFVCRYKIKKYLASHKNNSSGDTTLVTEGYTVTFSKKVKFSLYETLKTSLKRTSECSKFVFFFPSTNLHLGDYILEQPLAKAVLSINGTDTSDSMDHILAQLIQQPLGYSSLRTLSQSYMIYQSVLSADYSTLKHDVGLFFYLKEHLPHKFSQLPADSFTDPFLRMVQEALREEYAVGCQMNVCDIEFLMYLNEYLDFLYIDPKYEFIVIPDNSKHEEDFIIRKNKDKYFRTNKNYRPYKYFNLMRKLTR